MEVWRRRARVAGVAYGPDDIAGLHALARAHVLRIQMRVVVRYIARRIVLPDHFAAARRGVYRRNHTGSHCNDRCTRGREDVDAFVITLAAVARFAEIAVDRMHGSACNRERE